MLKKYLILILVFTLPSFAKATNEFEIKVSEEMPHILSGYRDLFFEMERMNTLVHLSQRATEPALKASFEQKMAQCSQNVSQLGAIFEDTILLPFTKQYAWAIPNDAVIDLIRSFSPIIEIGAGSGYWAKLLTDAGAKVVAYDDGTYDSSELRAYTKKWFDVQKGDEKAISRHPDHNLLLIWPNKRFAAHAVRQFQGKYLIYIGEPEHFILSNFPQVVLSSSTGDREFFELLERNFQLVHTANLPHWPNHGDLVYVYIRNP